MKQKNDKSGDPSLKTLPNNYDAAIGAN